MDKATEVIIKFFKTHETVKDTDMHNLAEQLKINPHDFEGKIYNILSSFLNQGKSGGKTPEVIDSELLPKAIAIEMEHTNNPELAKKIVFDHVAELGWNYYKELPILEEKLKREIGMDIKKGIIKVGKELSNFEKIAKSLIAYRTPMESKIDSIIKKNAILNEKTGGYAVLKQNMINELMAFYKSLDVAKQKEFLKALEYITPWNYVGGISNSDSDKIADIAEKVIRTVTGNQNFRLGSVKVAKDISINGKMF